MNQKWVVQALHGIALDGFVALFVELYVFSLCLGRPHLPITQRPITKHKALLAMQSSLTTKLVLIKGEISGLHRTTFASLTTLCR
ncbi:hypothetical protein DL93DRAFT_2073633, partial [Clavulina sp. PMI_390]